MHISEIEITNFRLLSDVHLTLNTADNAHPTNLCTVIVGRNNSGKTSLTEVFRRFDQRGTFNLEDFSNRSYEDFCDAFCDYCDKAEEFKVREKLPFIQLKLTVSFDAKSTEYGPLAEFIVDLNDDSTSTTIVMRYELGNGNIHALFGEIDRGESWDDAAREKFLGALRERIPRLFIKKLWSQDPSDVSNIRQLNDWTQLHSLFSVDFISAQRGLDDVTHRQNDSLASTLETLFSTAAGAAEGSANQRVAESLRKAVFDVQQSLNVSFNEQLSGLIPTFGRFGYPGLAGTTMTTETILEVTSLLKDFTKVRYKGHHGVPLPESYDGLGPRNLVYILLQLYGFYRRSLLRGLTPGLQLVFIEEPEVHLHPQMQEVFIRQLNSLAKLFSDIDDNKAGWQVQFIITTHSSHIANEAPFTSIRYFLSTSNTLTPSIRSTRVKDLSDGLGGSSSEHIGFLHQYLTLTRTDLFFADKAILVEGTCERLLLPKFIANLEASSEDEPRLSSQYVTVLEVGGAYAHLFLPLVELLELPTLIITDIDSVSRGQSGKGRAKASIVSKGTGTSNASIKSWFRDSQVAVSALLLKSDEDKIRDLNRLTYQVPEADQHACGRTFEDAFILANRDRFCIDGNTVAELEHQARTKADRRKKTDFALELLFDSSQWKTPKYIDDGLRWLLRFGGSFPAQEQTVVIAKDDDHSSVAVDLS